MGWAGLGFGSSQKRMVEMKLYDSDFAQFQKAQLMAEAPEDYL